MSPVLMIGVLGGLCVVALIFAVRSLVAAPRDEVLDRVQRVTVSAEMPAAAPSAQRVVARPSLIAQLVRPLSRVTQPEEGKDLTKARSSLNHAGVRSPHAVEVFFGSKLALALLFGAVIVAANASRKEPIPNALLYAAVLAIVGFFVPDLWLRGRIKERQLAISRGLPDMLDLLVTCVEAGLGLEAALTRVTIEIQLTYLILAQELRQSMLEIQAGQNRAETFRKLAERTGVDELRTLSATIIQTEMFGTSIANALRLHSESMRTRRTHRAEEQAAMVAVKMMIPLIFFILPSLFAVILGPAAVRIAQTLLPTLAGS